MRFIIMQFGPVFCCLIPLRLRYLHHPVIENPQLMFFPYTIWSTENWHVVAIKRTKRIICKNCCESFLDFNSLSIDENWFCGRSQLNRNFYTSRDGPQWTISNKNQKRGATPLEQIFKIQAWHLWKLGGAHKAEHINRLVTNHETKSPFTSVRYFTLKHCT
jgi:hypothetical protein